MGLCWCKPAKNGPYTPIEPYFSIVSDENELELSSSEETQRRLLPYEEENELELSSSEETQRRLLPYTEALEAIETNRCIICLETNIADKNVYDEWTDEQTDEKLLEAPDGVFGSLCHCDPQKTLCHLACLRNHMISLSGDPSLRRTCGFCDHPWSLIRTRQPGMSIALDLVDQKVEHTPAWRWKDIPAGKYWVRVQAGPGVYSFPNDIDIDLPDAYTAVQVEIFDENTRRVNVRKSLARLPVARNFTNQGVGQFISWEDLRTILDVLEASTLS
ncbi:MAG: hypothetical protein CMP20_04600 [Rickettsiales bacterium]|nr:hypothetical protein [Rickettsiales bacterium]